MQDKKCVHKVSSPKTTIVDTEIKNKYGEHICVCCVCNKKILFDKLPQKLRT